jgi:hypothetical protein
VGLLLSAAGVVGCGDDDSSADDRPVVVVPGDGVALRTRELGAGLAIDLPDSWRAEPVEAPVAPGAECSSADGFLAFAGMFVSVSLPSRVCSTGERQPEPLNGNHGRYLAVDDAYEPRTVAIRDTAAGSVTTFDQDYSECTNECRTTVDRVALLALRAPPDPDRPTVMFVASSEELTADQLARLAAAVHRT